jgi:hypothetical protein
LSAGVCAPVAVVADLGQDACAGQVGQAGEAGHDRRVGVLVEDFAGSLRELVGGLAGGVQLGVCWRNGVTISTAIIRSSA